MNRLIVEKRYSFFQSVADLAVKPPYDYVYNSGYACIEVDKEDLCFLSLTYRLGVAATIPSYEDMPTYVLFNDQKR